MKGSTARIFKCHVCPEKSNILGTHIIAATWPRDEQGHHLGSCTLACPICICARYWDQCRVAEELILCQQDPLSLLVIINKG